MEPRPGTRSLDWEVLLCITLRGFTWQLSRWTAGGRSTRQVEFGSGSEAPGDAQEGGFSEPPKSRDSHYGARKLCPGQGTDVGGKGVTQPMIWGRREDSGQEEGVGGRWVGNIWGVWDERRGSRKREKQGTGNTDVCLGCTWSFSGR